MGQAISSWKCTQGCFEVQDLSKEALTPEMAILHVMHHQECMWHGPLVSGRKKAAGGTTGADAGGELVVCRGPPCCGRVVELGQERPAS